MLKLGFITITGCSFWNIFIPPRGGLGPKGCVGHTLMMVTKQFLQLFHYQSFFLQIGPKFVICSWDHWQYHSLRLHFLRFQRIIRLLIHFCSLWRLLLLLEEGGRSSDPPGSSIVFFKYETNSEYMMTFCLMWKDDLLCVYCLINHSAYKEPSNETKCRIDMQASFSC